MAEMGSVYVMIAIPSAEHEKSLWIEKDFDARVNKRNLRPIKSSGNILLEHSKAVKAAVENSKLYKSTSEDSFRDKVDQHESEQPNIYIAKDESRVVMEKRLEMCLKELKIPNAVWVLGRAKKYYQVSFCTPAGEKCERIVQLLNEHEIGVEHNSTVSILPCTLYYEGKEHTISPMKASPSVRPAAQPCLQGVKEKTAWEQFVNSVRDRLMVAQVVAGVKSNAVFTFDFLILLIIASVTAAVGLVENSVVILVASMLISPLMGPVMASTFGFATNDWNLQKIGILSELLGLLLCVIIGFVYGIFIGYLSWESPDIKWPTPEMLTRGDLRSLWVGALIAVLSGAAVAIAVLGNHSGSLTGVAISASLMPPAVNAGLLWALAIVFVLLGDKNPQKLTSLTKREELKELVVLGALSLALTFINIICIFLMGIIVLKIKEVTPRSCKSYSKLLRKGNIQMSRDYNTKYDNRMEEGADACNVTDIHSHISYRVTVNECSLTENETMQNLTRPTVHEVASMWHYLTLHPNNRGDLRACVHHGRGYPSCNLAKLWSGVDSPETTLTRLEEHDSSSQELPHCSKERDEHRKFTVTPTNIGVD